MEMPDKIWIGISSKGLCGRLIHYGGTTEPYKSGLNEIYYHDRVLQKLQARIAELEAILEARGE